MMPLVLEDLINSNDDLGTIMILLGIHLYADQPRAHKVCIHVISLESEHIKLTCIDNF